LIGCLDESLDILADSIVNLHVADLVPPARRVPPGEGVLVWEELVPVLKSLPHLRQVTIELTRAGHDEIARAADFMLNCWCEL
jgi:sugar phosphate isomerase/epimerase